MISGHCQMLPGLEPSAATPKSSGCSQRYSLPEDDAILEASMLLMIRKFDCLTSESCVSLSQGKPRGHTLLRKGGGPGFRCRARLKVWHGGVVKNFTCGSCTRVKILFHRSSHVRSCVLSRKMSNSIRRIPGMLRLRKDAMSQCLEGPAKA